MPDWDDLGSVSYWFVRIRRNLGRDRRQIPGHYGHRRKEVFRARLFGLQVVSKPSRDPLPIGYPFDCQGYHQLSDDSGTGRLR